MTTPSPDRGAVSVEPMTDRELNHLRAESVYERDCILISPEQFRRMDARLCRAEDVRDLALHQLNIAEARALPSPRRYTGGPLEDGLYLWRMPGWHPTKFISMAVMEGVLAPYDKPWLHGGGGVWLIGPLPIPPIHESEEAK